MPRVYLLCWGRTWRRISIFEHASVTFASCVQGSLEQIQSVLNSTEVGLHQLTALVDCRSLHMVSHFVLEEKTPQIQDFLHNWLLSSPCRTTFRHWLGCVMTGWRVSSTWFSSPLSLLWCSPPLCAVCHIPGLARGNTHTYSLSHKHARLAQAFTFQNLSL